MLAIMSARDSHDYKIWAVDNIVYGPVELPTLVNWVKEERVTADTWVFAEQHDQWKRASTLPELVLFFKTEREAGNASGETSFAVQNLSSDRVGIKIGTLRRIKIFAGMSDDQLTRFTQFMEFKAVRQFTEIVRQGEPGDAMYLVLEGEVRVRLMIGGRETIVTVLLAGDFFGEIALFDHGPRSADVVANSESVLLKISAGAFQKVAREHPDLATPFLLAMGKTLTSRIRADNKRYKDAVSFARAAQ
jgi:hypothetical protein